MRFNILTAVMVLLITQSALATSSKKVTCPSVEALKVSSAMPYNYLWYGVEWKNYFDTKNEWTLVAGPVKNASNDHETVDGANYALPKMVYSSKQKKGESTLCFYMYDTFSGAVAITPARSPNEVVGFVAKSSSH